jgi:hypothetical protein
LYLDNKLHYRGKGFVAVHMDEGQKDLQRVSQSIRCYFVENPRAGESLEGIVRWWLQQQRFEEAWSTVSAALEGLVREGFLRRTANTGGNAVYSLANRPDDGC